MKVVYVIGPYRAKTLWELTENVRTAERLGLEVDYVVFTVQVTLPPES